MELMNWAPDALEYCIFLKYLDKLAIEKPIDPTVSTQLVILSAVIII